MTIADIVEASRGRKDARFTDWLGFVMAWECVFFKGTPNIRAEKVEGDNGGLTFAGVDYASHPNFPFHNPTPIAVVDVYFNQYWLASRAQEMAWPVGEVAANFAVNMGLGRAASMLQTAINQIPAGGSCRVDSAIGPKTVEASKLEDPRRLADLIEDIASDRYRGIASANPRQKKFLQGWLNRNADLEKWWMKRAAA